MSERAPLRVLIVEDNQDDVALMVSAIEEWGYALVSQVVTSEEEFRKALATGETFDAIIADYKLPHFPAAAAFGLLQTWKNRTPFLIVSDVQDDAAHLVLLKRGAADYVRKDRIRRLGAALERAVGHHQIVLRTERGLSLAGEVTKWLKDISGRLRAIMPGHEKEEEDDISKRLNGIIEKIDEYGKIGWKPRE